MIVVTIFFAAQRTSNTQIVVNTPILSRTVFDSLRGSNLEVDVNVKLLAESKEYARKDSSFMFYGLFCSLKRQNILIMNFAFFFLQHAISTRLTVLLASMPMHQ